VVDRHTDLTLDTPRQPAAGFTPPLRLPPDPRGPTTGVGFDGQGDLRPSSARLDKTRTPPGLSENYEDWLRWRAFALAMPSRPISALRQGGKKARPRRRSGQPAATSTRCESSRMTASRSPETRLPLTLPLLVGRPGAEHGLYQEGAPGFAFRARRPVDFPWIVVAEIRVIRTDSSLDRTCLP
jgi:hypothetical protein